MRARAAGYNAVHMRAFSLLLVCSAILAAEPAMKSAFDKPVFEDYVRHLLAVTNSEVKVQVDDPKPSPVPGLKEVDVHLSYGPASQDVQFYVSSDGRHVIRGEVFNINQSPFQTALDLLKTADAPAYGAGPGAPVTIVVFSDFECPLCKEEALSLRTNIVKDFPDKARVYFMDFPLSSIHPWASDAAIAGRCVSMMNPAAFWDYHDWVYEHQADITAANFTPKMEEWAKSNNLDQVQLGNCLQNRQTAEKAIDAEIAEGKALGIDKTPTLYVNGRKLEGNIPWDSMKMLIQYELDYEKSHPRSAAAASNEKCCEVTIPTAVGK
jgi:protein-disulfide isomerase